MNRLLFLSRHGETEWNAVGRLQGATDIPLNDVGREQAFSLGTSLVGQGVVAVSTSDLSRARETGQIAAKVLGVPATHVDPELRERRFGVFEGLTRAECEGTFPEAWTAWQSQAVTPAGGELVPDVIARMLRAIERCLAEPVPRLVISHGGALRLALSEIVGRPLLPMANGATWRLVASDGRYEVRRWVDGRAVDD